MALHKIQPKTIFFGKNTIYLPSCHSTNDFAAEMLQNQTVFEGTVVVTPDQTAGRGQRGNVWEAKAGQNLTFSLVLKPVFLAAMQQFDLNVAVSVAIQRSLGSYFGEELRIKWSNDVYVGNQKLGGVLIENTLVGHRLAHAIVGIGLNINQTDFTDEKATSFKKKLGRDFSIEQILENVLENLEKTYLQLKANKTDLLRTEYLNSLFRINQIHTYQRGEERFLGEIVGVSPTGVLQIRVGEQTLEFGTKEVSFVFE